MEGINTLTALFLTAWQKKTQVCAQVYCTQLENNYRAFLRLGDLSSAPIVKLTVRPATGAFWPKDEKNVSPSDPCYFHI